MGITWAKHHEKLLAFFIGLFIVLFSLRLNVIHAERGAVSLVKEYLNPERVAMVEQKIQNKPVEPHTEEEQRIPIFVYHSVRPHVLGESKSQDLFDITPELFEQQLIYLRDNGYIAITTKDLFTDPVTGKVVTYSKKPVMLTFDDGWKNQYEYAFPLLKKYNVKAVFYIYIEPLGAPSFLTWEEIKEMKDSGMVIGSHTITHPLLKKLSDEQLRHEIVDSKKILEKHLGTIIEDFASPYGYSNDRIVAVIKDAGYRTARTLYKSSYHKDLLNLRGYLAVDAFENFVSSLETKE